MSAVPPPPITAPRLNQCATDAEFKAIEYQVVSGAAAGGWGGRPGDINKLLEPGRPPRTPVVAPAPTAGRQTPAAKRKTQNAQR